MSVSSFPCQKQIHLRGAATCSFRAFRGEWRLCRCGPNTSWWEVGGWEGCAFTQLSPERRICSLCAKALPALTPLLSRMFPWGCELCALAVFSCSPHVDSVNFRRFLLPLTPEQLYRSEVSNSLAGKKRGCILPCVVLVKAMSSAIQWIQPTSRDN